MAPTPNKSRWFLGSGFSMAPLFDSKTLIRAAECLPEDIQPGDIIVYCGNRHHVCHRVLLREQRGGALWFFLSGNDPLRADGWIPAYRIIAKVVEIDGQDLSHIFFKWKLRLFHWHGVLELVILHKVLGGGLARLIRKVVHPRLAEKRLVRAAFLKFSALLFPKLRAARCLSHLNAGDFAAGSS